MNVEELKKYKDSLYSALSRDLDAFEKNFILISSGILAFSITFIKEIVKIEDAILLPVLFISWGLILASVGLMMFAFLSSVNGSNKLWAIVDDFIVANDLYNADCKLSLVQNQEIKNKINTSLEKIKIKLKLLRRCAIWFFLFGVLFFSLFVGVNLIRENRKDNSIKVFNPKRSTITIKSGKVETTTNDSLITINGY